MEIRRLGAHEGPRLRAIRLRALAEAPDAFGSTHDEAEARPPDSWDAQLREIPTFVAVVDGEDVGIVRGARDDSHADAAWLISMWVAPEVRGQGVGEALIDAVVGWARASGAGRLLLDVGDHNRPAIALYARMGFQPNGTTGSLPAPRDYIREHQRELRL
ncbi:MAG: GNAT family N-acetyltransferase [Gemmatimonadaceae bacterium]|nr:GNAT family N-acetyltransferase [Gemmatimonadaceae bacterium]